MRLEKDLAFVGQFDSSIYLIQDVTGDLDALDYATQLAGRRVFDSGARRLKPPGVPRHRGGTLLYDAIECVSRAVAQPHTGRKAIVILSDGEDNGSFTSLNGAIEAAQRSDLMIYTILFQGGLPNAVNPFPGPFGLPRPRTHNTSRRGADTMKALANATGGRYYLVNETQTLDAGFDQIEEDLRHQYSLGYTPDPPPTGSSYRRIRLTTRGSGLAVRTRDGYYPA
jgi:VWFA-related protein